MIFVDNAGINDPRVNLAIEEHLFRNVPLPEEILLFYINEPSIIVGRNQNAIEEINRDYVEDQQIHVVRRLSGGGAVYHDLGNLNFSLVTRAGREDAVNFRKFTAPVVSALCDMGVPAELGGRNDILIEGRKISGNAIYTAAPGLVCHGTLLFDTDLSRLSQALNVKPEKIASKGIKSVRSRVANISEFIPAPMDVETFRRSLLEHIFAGATEIPEYRLTPADWESIHKISAERYQTWEWNYGRSPAFNVQRVRRFPIGEIDARIQVESGLMTSVRFYGDFFGQEDVSTLEQRLAGVRYERASLRQALAGVAVERYFSGVTGDEFLAYFYDGD